MHLGVLIFEQKAKCIFVFLFFNLQLPYYFIEDLFIGGWMADRCKLPKLDIKDGLHMIPPIKPAKKVVWNVDKIFHYADTNFKIKVHHLLTRAYAEKLI